MIIDYFYYSQRGAAEHNLELMMIYDMFEEPAIGMEDTDLKRIFEETCSNYTISYEIAKSRSWNPERNYPERYSSI